MKSASALLRSLGIAMVAVVVAMAAFGEPGFGASGDRLLLLAAVVAFAVSASVYLAHPRLTPATATGVFAIVAASVVTVYVIDVTSTVVGLFLLGALAALREPRRAIALLLVATLAVYDVVQVSTGHESVVSAVATDAGVAFFLLVGRLVVQERAQRERVAVLLAEAERRKHLEREASVTAERGRMARELHDVLAHTLSGLALHLEAARLLAGKPGTDPALHDAVDDAHRLARAGLQEARRAVGALRGEELPGPALIPHLVEEHRLSAQGPSTLAVTGTPVALAPEAELALYRATQEALSNVRKHAGRAGVAVELTWGSERVELVVEDRGAREPGSPVVAHDPGYGLTGMAERATLLGADLQTGATETGYRVRLSIPYESNLRTGPMAT